MDRVRFGRALGFGARQAMKTIVATVDAATAENPSSGAGSASGPGRVSAASAAAPRVQAGGSRDSGGTAGRATPVAKSGQTIARAALQARDVPHGVKRGGRRLGEAVWSPFVRLSGVVWLEVMGVFFGIFAVSALAAVWRLRGEWHLTATNAASHRSLLGAVAMSAVFGYFCVSNFVRAKRRERRR